MRKLAVALALASTALASPALARDDSWYVGVEGGVMLVEDLSLDIGTAANAATVNHDYGYDVGGVVGYDFGGFRAEVEVAYRQASSDFINVTGAAIPSSALALATFRGTTPTNGSVNALSFMLNGMLDFGEDDGLQGFVGAGAGVARSGVTNVFANPAWLDDSDTGFAWQVIAGVRAPLTHNIDAGLRYRFFNADNVDLVDRLGRNVGTRVRTHSLMGTLTYNFGEPPAPPPPPVVAPPPR
ncbi:MAG: outer membrane beta-barrel protein, partial [Sphingopyxis sp.]